jgi:hypothetical protein
MVIATLRAGGQAGGESARELIRRLGDPSDPVNVAQTAAVTCGSLGAAAERTSSIEEALVRIGPSALPEIEKALASIERHGEKSIYASNCGILFRACAKLKGPVAFPVLQRFSRPERFAFCRAEADAAIALSLGLTSYVDAEVSPPTMFRCFGNPDIRHGADWLIHAWEIGNRLELESALGPKALASLQLDLSKNGGDWESFRAANWPWRGHAVPAVGYTFANATSSKANEDPGVETTFTDSLGRKCGVEHLRFTKVADHTDRRVFAKPPGFMPMYLKVDAPSGLYLVDNSNIVEILRTISACVGNR